ncbi:MAG: hypothetical protein J2P17_01715 [Mycobacterium sp.]|nr:hypothetical protein [Mycobacterium sp.]
MTCWDRHHDQIIGYFSPRQVRWLREHVGDMYAALQIDPQPREMRADSDEEQDITPFNPDIWRTTAKRWTPSTAWSAATHPGGPERVCPEFTRHRVADMALVLDTLPEIGGVVTLSDVHCIRAWVWSLAECGMHLTWRLGLQPYLPLDRQSPCRGTDRTRRSVCGVLAWLDRVTADLLDIAGDLFHPPESTPTTSTR